MSLPHYDVVVVGARLAGPATARLLAEQGRRVLAIDRARPGTDTLSTHAILRTGVLQLHRWGLLDRVVAAGTPPLGRTTFSYAGFPGGGEPLVVDLRPADGIDALYAPRRTVLDPILVGAAADAGVDVRFQTSLIRLQRDRDGRVRGVAGRGPDGRSFEIAADLVVGADGTSSRVAELVGAPFTRRGRSSGLAVYTYVEGLETDGNEWHYAPGAAAGLIPTNEGRTCVFAGTAANSRGSERHRPHETPGATFTRLLDQVSPELARRVATGRRVERYRAFAGRPSFFRRPYGPGWALVGDAGYFKDPITAHGITDALRDAELLARAVADDDLAGYEATRDAVSAAVFTATDEIAGYAWRLQELQDLLLGLSRAMQDELDLVRSWSPGGTSPSHLSAA